MDSDDLRSLLRESGTDLWDLINAAIAVAAQDHAQQLRARRDGIVERLYSPPVVDDAARLDGGGGSEKEEKGRVSPYVPQSVNDDEAEDDEEGAIRYPRNRGRLNHVGEVEEEDEQSKILAIKEHIEDPDQDEETLVNLLQNLADMDITFKALQDTDIGRHVNGLRKHPSGEVRRLVKLLVRKWKDLVDDWVKFNANEASAASIITDGDSPQQIPVKSNQNGHHVSERAHSASPSNGISFFDRSNSEPESRPKVTAPARTPTPPIKQKPPAPPLPSSAPPKAKDPQKDSLLDSDRLASARRRLHENYQEAENGFWNMLIWIYCWLCLYWILKAKKQRTIQVMDIHEIPKKKNVFYPKSKQGKHW